MIVAPQRARDDHAQFAIGFPNRKSNSEVSEAYIGPHSIAAPDPKVAAETIVQQISRAST